MPIVVVNFDGSELSLLKPAERIISLVPSETETLYYLGAAERIVGITEYCIHPRPLYKSRPRVGGPKTPKFERIRELAPDLILASKEENTREAVEELRGIAPTYVCEVITLDDAQNLMAALGILVGEEENAARFNATIETARQRFSDKPPGYQFRRALYLVWKQPYRGISEQTYIFHLLSASGLKPLVFPELPSRYPELTSEVIAQSGAELVIFPDEPFNFTYRDIDEFSEAFPQLPAVTNHALFKVDGATLCWYGYRTTYALEYIARVLQEP